MTCTVNGMKTDIDVKGRTIGEILAELDERAESMGDIIIGVSLDGLSLDADHLAEISDQAASGQSILELVSEPAAAMKGRALETLLELVSASSDAVESGDAELAGTASTAWNSFKASFAGLFSAEEASFMDAYGEQLNTAGAGHGNGETRMMAENLSAFFGDRLTELRDPSSAMLGAARVFDAIKDDLSEVPIRLQTGKENEAMKTMVLVVELINKTVRIMPEYARSAAARDQASMLLVEGSPMADFYGALNDVLRELASAFENKDGVLIGDLAEYEIRPRLESFFNAVRQSAGVPC